MTDTTDFFLKKQSAAVLKHSILKRYLPVFVQKTGYSSPGGRVCVFDAYAGPGLYSDGGQGSPALLLDTARDAAARNRTLELFLAENDKKHAAELQLLLNGLDDMSVTVFQDDAKSVLPQVIERASGAPLFSFVDPYGLGFPFRDMTKELLSRGPATECLLNFSTMAVDRISGVARKPDADLSQGERTTLGTMDAFCGGDWWRAHARELKGEHLRQKIAVDYAARVASATRMGNWVIPVMDLRKNVKYYLIFFSAHEDGLFKFGESLSSAMEHWRKWCDEQQSESLLPIDQLEREMQAGWVDQIHDSLGKLLDEGRTVRIFADHAEYMGDLIGLAREKHIRAAIKQLYKENRTSCTGVGNVQKMVIQPAN